MGDSSAVLRSVFCFWELWAPVVRLFLLLQAGGEKEQKKDQKALAQATLLENSTPFAHLCFVFCPAIRDINSMDGPTDLSCCCDLCALFFTI